MKKAVTLLTFVIFFGITEKSCAQNNLQFNKVVYLSIPSGASDTLIVQPLTVLKIESFAPQGGIAFDGVTLNATPTPIWYPSGTYIITNITGSYKALVSGILFNID